MKIRRHLTHIRLLGALLSAASTGSGLAQVLFFDNFQQFATGTYLTSTNYTPQFGPATASVVTSVQNGSPTMTVSNFVGNTWALFNNSVPTNKNQYEGILASVQTNQSVQVTWNLWIQATNTGPGMFMLSVPDSDPNAAFNPLLLFTDTGAIIALTNGTSVQVPIGNWGSLAGTIMTNTLILNYPAGTFSYSLNGQTLATLPLEPYFTNVVGAIYFNGFERSAGSLGNRFAIADVEVEAFSPSNIFTYTTSNGAITITGYTGTNTTAIIPGTINGLPVTAIGSFAFENQTSLMSVTIPGSVTGIGADAFLGSGLTSLVIGGGATNIGDAAFAFCSSLTNVTIPGSVASIGEYAFENDPGLTQIYFLGNAPSANSTVFSGDQGTVYYVPGTTGWTNNFGGLPTAQWYQPNPVILGSGYGLGAQTNGFGFIVSWATNLSVIVQATTNLANPHWTPVVTNTLSNGFFYFSDPGWTNYPIRFYRITGTNAVAFFTASPIYGQTPLAVQFNSANVDNLGNPITNWHWNFGDGATSTAQNPSHTYTNIGPFNPGFTANNSYGTAVIGSGPQIAMFTFTTTTNNGAMTITGFVSSGVGAVTIPTTINSLPVTSIGASAFSNCTNITSVTIPNTVTNVGQAAFYDCPRLKSVTIPNSITFIGDNTFSSCGSLRSVVIGNSVTKIGNFAFAFCASLTNIMIPNSVASIGAYAFGYCSSLTSVTISDSVISIGDFAFSSCGGLSNVVIGNSVTNVGNFAFAFCTNLTSASIPESVTSIGNAAFQSCGRLAYVAITGGDIGDCAFHSCDGLSRVVIGNSVTNIGDLAFAFCSNLTGITIPISVINTGDSAFHSCAGLASVTIAGGNIGDYAFSCCGSLISVVIGSSVSNIGVGAFADCGGLTNVTIPGSVTDIGGCAFDNCEGMTSVAIGSGVSSIGSGAFLNNYNLQAVYFQGNAPTLPGVEELFQGANAAVAKIYYLPGTTGWNPQVQTRDGSFGVHTNQFGFNISGNNSLSVIVEACTNLNNPLWLPVATNTGSSYFSDSQWINYPVRFYRLQAPSFAGLPVVLWNPVMQTEDGRFGLRSNRFGFDITGTANIPIVVEACTNLANPTWAPLLTGTLTNGSLYFSDPAWRYYPERFYRISAQ